jgi:hypothetical protein
MSYEGYVQVLCKAGHSHNLDCYTADEYTFAEERGSEDILWKCKCGQVAGWWHAVDTTNDDGSEYRVQLVVVTHSEVEQCNLGHYHAIREATYKPSQSDKGCYTNGGLL